MQSGWVEIFFLAMLAGFIGLRLYHVLGRRTGDDTPSNTEYRPPNANAPAQPYAPSPEPEVAPRIELPAHIAPAVRIGLQDIMQADRNFAPDRFIAGAQGAYSMILEAFWKGDIATLRDLASDEMLDNFQAAIDARNEAGERVENRLVHVDRAEIVAAHLNGSMAEVTVRFDAEIISATRDAEGRVISGDLNRPIETHDLWTFSHHVTSFDPAWLLIATDEVE